MEKVKAYLITILLVVLGGFLVFEGVGDINGMKNPEDFNEIDVNDIEKGMYMKGVTNFVIDYYCYEEETTLGVIKNETNRWYLIPCGENLEYYIGVKVSGDKEFEKYETVCDDTWKYLEGEADAPTYNLNVQGKVAKCAGDVLDNLNAYIKEYSAAFEEDCSDMFLPYYIDLTTTSGNTMTIVFGALMIIGGIAFLLISLRSAKKKEEAAALAAQMQARQQMTANTGYTGMGGTQPGTNAQGFYTANGTGDELDRILREEEEQAKKSLDDLQ